MAQDMLWTGSEDARATLLLAHGAGAPMDSPAMTAAAEALAGAGLRVARFEFAYMAARRAGLAVGRGRSRDGTGLVFGLGAAMAAQVQRRAFSTSRNGGAVGAPGAGSNWEA